MGFLVFSALGLFPISARACSPAFSTTIFEYNPDVADLRDDNLPVPSVEIVSIGRGTGSDGVSCEDMGYLEISVALLETSPLKIGDVGIMFVVSRGQDHEAIFPDGPLAPFEGYESQKNTVLLPWLDGATRDQRDIDLDVQAFFVTREGAEGPRAEFSIRSRASSDPSVKQVDR